MPSEIPQPPLTVALIGNPNTGKSTLFNALAAIRQRVGNYPGVTVEKKTGLMDHQGRPYELIDLPGLYSLAPRSRDEMVAVDVLLGRGHNAKPADAVVCIVDASNLQRNLYLASQVFELRLPTVLAVNMVDVAEARGLSIDVERLQRQLGMPVVRLQANRGIGIAELRAALARVVGRPMKAGPSLFPEAFEEEVSGLRPLLSDYLAVGDESSQVRRYLVRRLLLDMDGYLAKTLLPEADQEVGRQLQAARDRLSEAGCAVPAVETKARYGWIGRVLDGVVTRSGESKVSRTDRIDRLL
ncbi:MAG: 50S ribosome-binding GTPase, partial [Planctomycetes bacterium]|nr:50S ribosome-binding GTPase [Planctomycetota bacterium]